MMRYRPLCSCAFCVSPLRFLCSPMRGCYTFSKQLLSQVYLRVPKVKFLPFSTHSIFTVGTRLGSSGHTLTLTILLICSIILNLGLSLRLKQLRPSAANYRKRVEFNIGSVASSFIANDSNGQQVTISYKDSPYPTILYILSSDCSWCSRNEDNIETLAKSVRDKHRLIGISLSTDKLGDYVPKYKYNPSFPVYSGLSDTVKISYDLTSTPQTIIISPEGKVIKIWRGAYRDSNLQEIEGYFNIKLPGIAP